MGVKKRGAGGRQGAPNALQSLKCLQPSFGTHSGRHVRRTPRPSGRRACSRDPLAAGVLGERQLAGLMPRSCRCCECWAGGELARPGGSSAG